jgi:nuclear cap-binding protein subunit 1
VLDLPVIIVPAEIDEAVSVATEKFTASSTGLRGDEGVGYEGTRIYHKFFDDDVSFLHATSANSY